MKLKILIIILIAILNFSSCGEDFDDNSIPVTEVTFKFEHSWDDEMVTNANFNTIQYTNQNGEMLSIERLRYVISDITFTSSTNEIFEQDMYHLVDLADTNSLIYALQTQIPQGTYNVSFTFGLDNEDNSENLINLNSASFNVPESMEGGYHYMQFDGKFINSSNQEQGFNYHAIRAVENAGPNPSFPQDTFFSVNLGSINLSTSTAIEIKMNIAEWFKNPITWDLNEYNQMLMPNASAQIMMFENGQSVFSLGLVNQ